MNIVKKLDEKRVALTFGLFLAGCRLIWSLIILLGLAQYFLNFAFWAHMIANPYRITGFTLKQSLILIGVIFVIGYVGGFVFAKLWNKKHR